MEPFERGLVGCLHLRGRSYDVEGFYYVARVLIHATLQHFSRRMLRSVFYCSTAVVLYCSLFFRRDNLVRDFCQEKKTA